MINWSSIDTVLFDMDGTLLDLHYDNHFWTEYLPDHYAKLHQQDPDQTRTALTQLFISRYGELEFYCVDHWSDQLGLDLMPIKAETAERIQFLPHATRLINALHERQLNIAIVTNAHAKTFTLKDNVLNIRQHINRVFTSHQFGLPKEDPKFWHRLAQEFTFNPKRTLLVDDNLDVLTAAQTYGIEHLAYPLKPDSKKPAKSTGNLPEHTAHFYFIESLDQLIP